MKKIFLLVVCTLILFSGGISAQLTNLPTVFNESKLAGHWEFKTEAEAYKATKGTDLTPVNNPTWVKVDEIGTVRIDYQSTPSNNQSLQVAHGLPGSSSIYNFSFMFDIKIDASKGAGANITSLYRPSGYSDGRAFVGFSDGTQADRKNGMGLGSYVSNTMNSGGWNRVIVNASSDWDNMHMYVIHPDGTWFENLKCSKGYIALQPNGSIHFFGDEDSENGRLNVSQIAFFNNTLTREELAGLGLPPVNIALNKEVTSSASQDGYPVTNINDGKYDTRWGSGGSFPGWATIHFDGYNVFDGIQVNTYKSGNRQYKYNVYVDSELAVDRSENDQEGNVNIYDPIANLVGNSIKIDITGSTNGGSPSINEVEVFGWGIAPKALNQNVEIDIETKTIYYIEAFAKTALTEQFDIYGSSQAPSYTITAAGDEIATNDKLTITYKGISTEFTFEQKIPTTPTIIVNKESIDFGKIIANIGESTDIEFYGISLEEGKDITPRIEGEGASVFNISNTSQNEGKTVLTITAIASNAGTYSANLVLETPNGIDLVSKTINLSVEAIAGPILSSTDDSNETWYYIKSVLGAGVLTDLGTNKLVDCFPAMDGYEDNQLWKLVGTDYSTITLINKNGNTLSFSSEAYQIQESSTTSFKLTKSSFSNATYAAEKTFCLNDGTGNLSKIKGTGFDRQTTSSEDKTAFVFLTENEIGTLWNAPKMSTDINEYWYKIQIRFNTNNFVEYAGRDIKVTRKAESQNEPKQLWKFVGSLDDMKIVSMVNDEALTFKPTELGRLYPVSFEDGDRFKLEVYKAFDNNNYSTVWRIKNLDKIRDNDKNQVYLNATGMGGNSVTLYGIIQDSDTPLDIKFVEIPTTEWNGNSLDWDDQANWSNGVPTALKSAVILSGNPTIPSTGASAANLILGEGVQLTLDGPLQITRKVKIEKTVAKATWYPIGFPFEMSGAYHDSAFDGFDEEPYLVPSTNGTDGDYWLNNYNGTSFNLATSMAKGTGYIAQFPSYFDKKTITYLSAVGITISNETLPKTNGTYQLVANPTLTDLELTSGVNNTHYYILNAEGTKFDLITTATVKPFEAFIMVIPATGSPLKPSIEIGDGYTSLNPIKETNEYGEIVSERYYNMQGLEISKPNSFQPYIKKTTYESGEEIITKFIKNK